MSTIAMVQARMGSSRLPGKVLEPLAGRPALAHIVERLQAAPGVDEVAVLTSLRPLDEPIAVLCHNAGIHCVRGSERDVLDRFEQASRELEPDRIVRVTADCPLVDPEVVGRLLALAAAQPREEVYASVATGAIARQVGYRRYPDGLDAETFTAGLLHTAWREAADPFEREHVTPFLWRQPERFAVVVLEAAEDIGAERWTIDHAADLELVRALYERLERNGDGPDAGGGLFGFREVLALLEREPRLREINAAYRVAD
jgi:spore coat polysaccharide biosynthesis protein SpsF